MSEPIVRLDEPKQKFDKEEARDFMDEVWRYIDRLENTVIKLEEGGQHKQLDIEIRDREIMSLKYQIGKLTDRLIESGEFCAT